MKGEMGRQWTGSKMRKKIKGKGYPKVVPLTVGEGCKGHGDSRRPHVLDGVRHHGMEMGMKQNMMTRTKNHTHSICTILYVHEVRGGMRLFNGSHTSGVVYSSITKMQINQGVA